MLFVSKFSVRLDLCENFITEIVVLGVDRQRVGYVPHIGEQRTGYCICRTEENTSRDKADGYYLLYWSGSGDLSHRT